MDLGEALKAAGEFRNAEQADAEAVEEDRIALRASHPWTANSLARQADAPAHLGDPAKAEILLRRALIGPDARVSRSDGTAEEQHHAPAMSGGFRGLSLRSGKLSKPPLMLELEFGVTGPAPGDGLGLGHPEPRLLQLTFRNKQPSQP